MNITIRLEKPEDYREVEVLTREAFWNLFVPGCDEHLLVHNLRKSNVFIPELDLVAEYEGKIVGHIIYSTAKVIDNTGKENEVILFGPLTVLPTMQKKGIGAKLLSHSLKVAKDLGYKAVIIFGHPEYYPKFGFVNAEKYSITTSEGKNFDAFMALELYENSLSGITGKFYIDDIFNVDKDELEEFEKTFPYKEKGEPKHKI